MIKLILNVLGATTVIGFFYILFWTSCAIIDHCYNNIGAF